MQQSANALVLYDEASDEDRRKEQQRLEDSLATVLLHLNQLASDAVARRKSTELRWMENLRQYHGVYEANVLSVLKDDDSRSQVFINITRPKTNAWIARLGDMLFPNDERNWGIDPTPVPQLSSAAREVAAEAEELDRQIDGLVAQHNAEVDAAGGPVASAVSREADALITRSAALRAEARQRQREIELAQKRCKAMERLIDDQLTESNYPARSRDVIDDMCKVGSGVLKGPIVNDRRRGSWTQATGDDGAPLPNVFRLTPKDDAAPKFRRVDYWHFFPDPSAQCMEDCEYTLERHLPNRKMLRRMAKELDFSKAAVARLLKDGPRSQSPAGMPDLHFMAELRALESGETQSDGVDALADRYLVWEYHGPLEADQISAMLRGTDRHEEADEIDASVALEVPMVRVFFCGSQLLRIDNDYILDSDESLYSVATFEKGEATVLGGIGVPQLMRNEQQMLNSAVRMMLDNAALSVGPQVVIDKDSVAPENGRWKLTPRKVWQWITGPGGQKREKPFETFDIPMNQEMLAAIIQLALRFVDEAVSMPLIAQGEMGAHVTKTSSGMSMLFNSANVGFRRVVKNWDDDVTTGVITRTYDFNMQFSDREDVKGDMKVEARGTSVLLVRELQAEQLMGIIREWAAHPILGVGFRAYHAMRLVLQAMSINPDDLLLAEDDYLAKLKQMSENDGQSDPETVRAQTQLQVAQIDAESRGNVANINLQAANLRAQTAFAELAMRENISLAQIQAMFRKSVMEASVKAGVEKEKIASKERALAAEIGVERENKREAQAMGMEPTGSGGAISMGARPVERRV